MKYISIDYESLRTLGSDNPYRVPYDGGLNIHNKPYALPVRKIKRKAPLHFFLEGQ